MRIIVKRRKRKKWGERRCWFMEMVGTFMRPPLLFYFPGVCLFWPCDARNPDGLFCVYNNIVKEFIFFLSLMHYTRFNWIKNRHLWYQSWSQSGFLLTQLLRNIINSFLLSLFLLLPLPHHPLLLFSIIDPDMHLYQWVLKPGWAS